MSATGPVVILGAGLTGLSAAHHLSRKGFLVVEREERVGGKARSHRRDGHTFDVTGHWLHLRDDRIRRLINRLFTPGELVEIERRTGVWSNGVMLTYPFQANLHGLPLEVVQECLVGFVEARERAARGEGATPRTFEEFAIARFGHGIARHFFVPYNTKLWGMHPNELTPAWVSRYIPVPDVAQVIGGALGLRQEGLGYNARFLYPARGGIDAVPEALAREISASGGRIELGAEVEEIDPVARQIRLRGHDQAIGYGRLISTIPLPELIHRMKSVPSPVREAAGQLRSVKWRWLDVATTTVPPMAEHWVYVPEPHIPFFRVGVYSNAVASTAPPGQGSLYVELSDRTGRPDLEAVFGALTEMGAITSPDDVKFADLREVDHAYVLFDDAWEVATNTVCSWLDGMEIRSCGRYGSWIYNSMEDSMLQGIDAAAWAERE